jgi:hypothetical protein
MRLAAILLVVLLSGCASGYRQFYTNAPWAKPEAVAAIRVSPAPTAPTLVRAGGEANDVAGAYARDGYVLIGYSSFNSGHRESDSAALAQGKKVGADLVVVLDPHYTGSITRSVPITTPTTSTSYATGTATAYGTGGMATAYGNSTTTTYGTETTYLPMTVHRFDYGALYLVKRHYSLGVLYRDLNDGERRALESNQGVCVTVVVNGSPAFRSDVLVGDFIVAIDGQQVFGQAGFSDLLGKRRGQAVELAMVRNGKRFTKTITLDN